MVQPLGNPPERAEALGIDLYPHQQAIDTTTPAGKAMLRLCGRLPRVERSIIGERIDTGLARARANGKRLGRPRVEKSVEQAIRQALGKRDKGMRKFARETGVGVSVVQRVKLEHSTI